MKLLKSAKRRTTSVQWPEEVDSRLDVLQRVAASHGVQISRAQLLAALVAHAPLDGPEIAAIALDYLHLAPGSLAVPSKIARRLPRVEQRGRRRRSSSE